MTAYKSTGAGHGGKKNGSNYTDPGALSKDRKKTEAAIVRTITNKMQAIKKVADSTDNAGTSVNGILYNQVVKMNNAGAGWAITNHLNAFNNKATGVEVWYWAGNTQARDMAAKLSKTIANTLGIVDRGAKATTALYVHRNTNAGVNVLLIEWAFIDNPSDLSKLESKMDAAVTNAMEVLGYKSKNKEIVYQTKKGWYEALKDDVFYQEKELKNKSGWNIKKGQRVVADEVVKVGKYTRGKVRLGSVYRYFTLRDDFFKKV